MVSKPGRKGRQLLGFMVSEARLKSLPDIEGLRKLTQSLAMLDAIMSPEWEYRYYSFNSKWGEGEMMASMRNGSGDEYFILFNSHGAILKGFDHESAMSPWSAEEEKVWPGIFDGVPLSLRLSLRSPLSPSQRPHFVFGDDTLIQLGMLNQSTTLMRDRADLPS
jgi:hypothetical protein